MKTELPVLTCVRTESENQFFIINKSENRARSDHLPDSGSNSHTKLIQASNEKKVVSIEFNYVFMQNNVLLIGSH